MTEYVDLARLAKQLNVTAPVLAAWLQGKGVAVLRLSRQRWRAEKRAVDAALAEGDRVNMPVEREIRPYRRNVKPRQFGTAEASRTAGRIASDDTTNRLPAGFVLLQPVRKRKQA